MPNVLLVEDDLNLRRVLRLNLTHRGYGIAEADSVQSACDILLATREPFDVVLLDVNLPDESGWELLRRIGASPTRTAGSDTRGGRPMPIIVLTGMSPLTRRIQEFHPAAVLIKPFPLAALLRAIARQTAPTRDDAAACRETPADGADGATALGS